MLVCFHYKPAISIVGSVDYSTSVSITVITVSLSRYSQRFQTVSRIETLSKRLQRTQKSNDDVAIAFVVTSSIG